MTKETVAGDNSRWSASPFKLTGGLSDPARCEEMALVAFFRCIGWRQCRTTPRSRQAALRHNILLDSGISSC